MLKRYHLLVGGAFRAVDLTLISLIWVLSYWLRFYFPIVEVTKGFPAFKTYAAITPLVTFLWWVVFSSFRVYRPRRILRRTDEVFLILKAHFFAGFIFIGITYFFSEYKYSRGVMVYFILIGSVSLVFFRLLLRNALRNLRKKGHNIRTALIIGEGVNAEAIVDKLERYPELGVKVVGALIHEDSKLKKVGRAQVLGNFSQINEILSAQGIDQILIALPRMQASEIDRILLTVKEENVEIRLLPDVHEYVTVGCEVEEFDGLPVVNLNDSPLDAWGVLLKRLTDVVATIILCVVISPLLLLIAVLIKLTSRGPILYSQTRMGLDGNSFKMYKFRSMRTGAEAKTGAVWAKADDDRKTIIGNFLRKTSLDELPQLWNVLKGEMSLVGPRPERPVFVEKFKNEIPHYMLRHRVKAGMTGWAQINGWRGNTSLDRRIEYDLYYIKNWSYLLDIKILILTLWKGFLNKNAY